MIPQYLDLLSDTLKFDRSLSNRVREEIEDHLLEAVNADEAGDCLGVQRVIANFGDPRMIASQFAAVSLARRSRTLGVGVLASIAAVFVAMKVRVAWFATVPLAMSGELKRASDIAISIDRTAFWFSIIVGIVGWLYVDSRSAPSVLNARYHKQIRRGLFVCATATTALAVTVISDGFLTTCRLLQADLSNTEWLFPIASMAIEVVSAGILAAWLQLMMRRTAALERSYLYDRPIDS